MTTRLLVLIEIDADGSIHVTSGPTIEPPREDGTVPIRASTLPAAPSWATGPNRREVTLARDVVRTRVVSRGIQEGRDASTGWVPGDVAQAFVEGLRWIAGKGERP